MIPLWGTPAALWTGGWWTTVKPYLRTLPQPNKQ